MYKILINSRLAALDIYQVASVKKRIDERLISKKEIQKKIVSQLIYWVPLSQMYLNLIANLKRVFSN